MLDLIDHIDLKLPGDLLSGFPMAGDLPVSHLWSEENSKTAEFSVASLLQTTGDFKPSWKSLRNHRPPTEVDQDIWSQTLEEVSLGRMSPLVKLEPHH